MEKKKKEKKRANKTPKPTANHQTPLRSQSGSVVPMSTGAGHRGCAPEALEAALSLQSYFRAPHQGVRPPRRAVCTSPRHQLTPDSDHFCPSSQSHRQEHMVQDLDRATQAIFGE